MADISYFGVEPTAAQERESRVSLTATAGQTNISAPYTVGFVDVYYNGAKLAPAEFTATNGATIILSSGAAAGATIDVVSKRQVVNYAGNIESTPIGQANPAPGAFTNLTATTSATGPTKPRFDNSGGLATTAFVNSVGRQYSSVTTITTSPVTLTSSTAGGLVTFISPLTGAASVTLPTAAALAFIGSSISFANYTGSAVITLNRSGSDFIQANSVNGTSLVLNPGDTLTLTSNGLNGWVAVDGSVQKNSYWSCFRACTPDTGGAGQVIPNNTSTKLQYSNVIFDDLGEYNSSTSTFTPTYSGIYEFSFGIHQGFTAVNGVNRFVELWKNGANVGGARMFEESAPSSSITFLGCYGATGPIKLSAGDQVDVRLVSIGGSTTVPNYAYLNYFAGKRVK